MPLPKERAWFAAKRRGYGWGLPLRWQGWLALLLYVAAVIAAALTLAEQNLPAFIAATVLLTTAFIGICYRKGEQPKWRWSGHSNDNKP